MFEKAKPMCEAIRELFKDEFEKIQEEYESNFAIEKKKLKDEGIGLGISSTINSCKSLGATREQTLALIVENFNLTEQNAEIQIKKYW